MYQVCTCPQSSLTSGDPNCPMHGKQPESVTYSWCESCAAKDARISSLEGELRGADDEIKYQLKMREAAESRLALLEKVARLTEEYLKWKNSRCIACDDGIDEEECTCTRDLEYAHKAEDKLNAALDAPKEGK